MAGKGRTPQEFLDEYRAAKGPTQRQEDQHAKEMEEVDRMRKERKAKS
jgi:hypothetical protein